VTGIRPHAWRQRREQKFLFFADLWFVLAAEDRQSPIKVTDGYRRGGSGSAPHVLVVQATDVGQGDDLADPR
jgi:hypothetical protein